MPPADLRALRDAVVAVMPELRARSAEAHYGYPVVENPHDFDPDLECCTPEEIANHKAACEAWDRGERDVRPHMCGNAAVNGWGIGAQTIHDEALMAALALADAISPEVVELVEAMRAWAEARAAKRAAIARDSAEATQESFVSWALAADEERASFVAVQALADRLAEKTETKETER